MSGTKHTDGPWEQVGWLVRTTFNGEGGWLVADCSPTVSSLPECRENARLIAAAPELLETLMAYDEAFGNRGPYLNTDPDHLALIAKSRAAIAKAVGHD